MKICCIGSLKNSISALLNVNLLSNLPFAFWLWLTLAFIPKSWYCSQHENLYASGSFINPLSQLHLTIFNRGWIEN